MPLDPAEIKRRQSNRDRGAAWLSARGRKAGTASGKARLEQCAIHAERWPTKTAAYLAGYNRGYRAAYKRWYSYFVKTRAGAA